jgi:hypothetical protein
MIATFLSWLGGKLAGPLAFALAVLFAAAFLWQSARINGVPLLGGGFKAQVAALQSDAAAHALADARAQAAALVQRQRQADAGEAAASAHAVLQAANEKQIQTVIREVPRYVTPVQNARCVVPWSVVRLLDAAASGADPDDVRARVAPGQPDDAASDVSLSEAVALLATDLGIARQNASQLEHLEQAVGAK